MPVTSTNGRIFDVYSKYVLYKGGIFTMAYCSNCGAELPAGAQKCPSCDAIIGGEVIVPNVVINEWDHTAEFDAKDISDNKIYAMCAYLLDIVGIIMAILVAKDSEYAKFHAREATKLTVITYLVAILTCILCWTCIVPIAGGILLCILFVVRIIAFVQVCNGLAREPWLIRSLKFLS